MDASCKAFSKPMKGGGMVHFIEMNIDDAEALFIGDGFFPYGFKLTDGSNHITRSSSKQSRDVFVMPFGNIVERSVQNKAFGSIAVIVEDENDGIESEPIDG